MHGSFMRRSGSAVTVLARTRSKQGRREHPDETHDDHASLEILQSGDRPKEIPGTRLETGTDALAKVSDGIPRVHLAPGSVFGSLPGELGFAVEAQVSVIPGHQGYYGFSG